MQNELHTNDEDKWDWRNLRKTCGLHQCQYPHCDIMLQLCERLPLQATGESVSGILSLFFPYNCI